MGFFKRSEENQQAVILGELRAKVAGARVPVNVEKIVHKELELLERTSPAAAEYAIGLAYIEYLSSLPWNKKTEDNLDIDRAEKILNAEHYGLYKIKERVLEHLAVKK